MDEMELLAADLVKAWRRYRELFGEDPHGTEQQISPSCCHAHKRMLRDIKRYLGVNITP